MGDMGDYYNDIKADLRERRARDGVECPKCKQVRPKTNARPSYSPVSAAVLTATVTLDLGTPAHDPQ